MGKYRVRRTATGVKFDLTAQNGEVIAASEAYDSYRACLAGVESLRRNAPAAGVEDQTGDRPARQKHPKFEVYRDRSGQFRFRLKAPNGRIIAVSESYRTHAGCLSGIQAVRKNADSPIAEE